MFHQFSTQLSMTSSDPPDDPPPPQPVPNAQRPAAKRGGTILDGVYANQQASLISNKLNHGAAICMANAQGRLPLSYHDSLHLHVVVRRKGQAAKSDKEPIPAGRAKLDKMPKQGWLNQCSKNRDVLSTMLLKHVSQPMSPTRSLPVHLLNNELNN